MKINNKNKFLLSFIFLNLFSFSLSQADLLKTDSELSPQGKKDKALFNSCFNAAKRGDAEAMGVLGLLYERGRGTPKDYGEAVKWLQRGARKNDASAQNNLGFLYLKGKGVKQSGVEALNWFQKAADQGLASAQENLGLLYGGGKGIKKDYEKAFFWFRKAAEQNELEAQINLAIMYSLGEGGPKDFIESHKWFSLALGQNPVDEGKIAELRDNIEWLEKRMNGRDIDEAKKRAESWKPARTTPEKSKTD